MTTPSGQLKQSIALLMCVYAGSSLAVGTVTQLSGVLTVKKDDGGVRILSQRSEVGKGDTLNTQNNAFAQIKFTDGSQVTMKPNTQLRIDDYSFDDQEPQKDGFFTSLLKGGLRTVTGLVGKRGNRNAYQMKTATATIGIRGTVFTVDDCVTTRCGTSKRASEAPAALARFEAQADVQAAVEAALFDGVDSALFNPRELIISDSGEVRHFAPRSTAERAVLMPVVASETILLAQAGGNQDDADGKVIVGVTDGEVEVTNRNGQSFPCNSGFNCAIDNLGNFLKKQEPFRGTPPLPEVKFLQRILAGQQEGQGVDKGCNPLQ
jgi:hypothetical protein